ncbi:unnamed protein product [Amoebophrya sp. A25]|nr:unnamed protein product [Amoebophrya sp. A25]|eukprot:GSA25T00010553001.1
MSSSQSVLPPPPAWHDRMDDQNVNEEEKTAKEEDPFIQYTQHLKGFLPTAGSPTNAFGRGGETNLNTPSSGSRRSSKDKTKTSLGAVLFNLSFLLNTSVYLLFACAGYDAMQPGRGHGRAPNFSQALAGSAATGSPTEGQGGQGDSGPVAPATTLSWFEALGDSISGDKGWERREYFAFVSLGVCMIGSGAYLQWLVFVFNESDHRLELSNLPDRVKGKLSYAVVTYLLTSASLALLVLGVVSKKFMEGRGAFGSEHALYPQLSQLQWGLTCVGGLFILSSIISMYESELRAIVAGRERKAI